MDNSLSDLTFEQALIELEKTVEQLESGELSLEQAVEQFEKGQRLSAHCRDLVKQAGLELE